MDRVDVVDDRGPQILAVVFTTTILAILAVAIRVWSRKRSKAGLWWDDWAIMASLVKESALLIHPICQGARITN